MQHSWCDFVISFIQFDIGYHRRPPNCHLIGEPQIFIRIKLRLSNETRGGGVFPLNIMVASWFRPNVWVFIENPEVSDEIQWESLKSKMGCNLCIHILYSVSCILIHVSEVVFLLIYVSSVILFVSNIRYILNNVSCILIELCILYQIIYILYLGWMGLMSLVWTVNPYPTLKQTSGRILGGETEPGI